jgi:hypothetical protein
VVNIAISLVGSNGDTIALLDSGDFVLTSGLTGFGIPITQVRIDTSAGDGGNYRHTKKGIREVDLPVTILGTSEADVQAKLRRLSRLLQTTLGATRIVATFPDSTSLFLEAHYVGGAETEFGENATSYFCNWVLQMQAPQPYWQTSSEISYVIGEAETGRGLLPQLTKLKLASSSILGELTINNVGDVPSFPRWSIMGPITDLAISNGTQEFTLPATIDAGDVVTINTATGTVVNAAGENVYALLGAAPKLFSFPTGITDITVTGADITDDTRLAFFYSPRYEVVH